MAYSKSANRGRRHGEPALLTAVEVNELRREIVIGGRWHGKPIFSLARNYNVGAAEIRKAIEGKIPYWVMPGVTEPPVELTPFTNLAIPRPAMQTIGGYIQEKEKEEEAKKNMSGSEGKISHQTAVEAVKMWQRGGLSQEQIGDKLGVHQTTVGTIVRFEGRWGYLKGMDLSDAVTPVSNSGPAPTTQTEPAQAPVLQTPQYPVAPGLHQGGVKKVLNVDNTRWRWGRYSVSPRLAHLWREYPDLNSIKSPPGCDITLYNVDKSHMIDDKTMPACLACQRFFLGLINKDIAEPAVAEAEHEYEEEDQLEVSTIPTPEQLGIMEEGKAEDAVIVAPASIPTIEPQKAPEKAPEKEPITRYNAYGHGAISVLLPGSVKGKWAHGEIEKWLRGILKEGPVPSAQLYIEAAGHGIGIDALRTAKAAIAAKHRFVKDEESEYYKKVEWYLPRHLDRKEPFVNTIKAIVPGSEEPLQFGSGQTVASTPLTNAPVYTLTVPDAPKNQLVENLVQAAQAMSQGDLRAYGLFTKEQIQEVVQAEKDAFVKEAMAQLNQASKWMGKVEEAKVALNLALEALDETALAEE